jgi:hypothetical protein
MPLRKIARIVEDARKDTALARQSATDPEFARKIRKDRRGTLSRFSTVKRALKDRERIEKAKAAKKKKASRARRP